MRERFQNVLPRDSPHKWPKLVDFWEQRARVSCANNVCLVPHISLTHHTVQIAPFRANKVSDKGGLCAGHVGGSSGNVARGTHIPSLSPHCANDRSSKTQNNWQLDAKCTDIAPRTHHGGIFRRIAEFLVPNYSITRTHRGCPCVHMFISHSKSGGRDVEVVAFSTFQPRSWHVALVVNAFSSRRSRRPTSFKTPHITISCRLVQVQSEWSLKMRFKLGY